MALQLHINISLNRPPDRTWRRPPGRPWNKWLDQLWNDSIHLTGELWGRAVDRGHGDAMTRRPSPATPRRWWWWWYHRCASVMTDFCNLAHTHIQVLISWPFFSGFAPSWAESPRKNLFVSDNDISCVNSMFLCRISVRSCLTMISWLVRTRRRLCNMRSALLTSILEFHACLMQKVCDASNSLYYLITNCFSLITDIRSQKSFPWKTSGWRSKRRQ